MDRRRLLLAAIAAGMARPVAATDPTVDYPPVVPRALTFPRDHGAHPDFRIEWWYLTAVLGEIGLQLTFFRLRTALATPNPSRFAARQLVFAHAAVADPARGALLHAQRIERAGPGVTCSADDLQIVLDAWRLARRSDGTLEGQVDAPGLRVTLRAEPRQPLLLQGDRGVSHKGDEGHGAAASYYYSLPQIACRASIDSDGKTRAVDGIGWFDHEWSSALLPDAASGWDWLGFNLDDGSALTAFRIRTPGGATISTYASLRTPGDQEARTYEGDAVGFAPLALWESPRTRARYPIATRITVAGRTFETRPMMPDQELDARATSGIVYWEGASRLLENGVPVGRGYLELTGYAERFRL